MIANNFDRAAKISTVAFDHLWPRGAPFPPTAPWLRALGPRKRVRVRVLANSGVFNQALRQQGIVLNVNSDDDAGTAYADILGRGSAIAVELLVTIAAATAGSMAVAYVVKKLTEEDAEGDDDDTSDDENDESGTDDDEDSDEDEDDGVWDPPPEGE